MRGRHPRSNLDATGAAGVCFELWRMVCLPRPDAPSRTALYDAGALVKRYILGFVFLAAATGCVTRPPGVAPIAWQDVEKGIPTDRAMIYFVRPSAAAAGLQTYALSVNGIAVSAINTGRYFSYVVAPGKVSIAAWTAPSVVQILAAPTFGSPKLDLETRTGEISFVKIGVNFFGGPTLARVEPDEGKALVGKALLQAGCCRPQ